MYSAISGRTYPPALRIAAAFLIAPGAAALLFAIVMPAFEGISDPFERVWRTAFVVAAVGAYPATLIIGIPAFLMLRRYADPKLTSCSLTGAAVAALPWLILSMLSLPDSASIGGQETVIKGSMTPHGWLVATTSIGQIAILGSVGGALFWLIAVFGSGAGRRR